MFQVKFKLWNHVGWCFCSEESVVFVKPAESSSRHCRAVLPTCEMPCDWYIEPRMLSLHTVGQCVKTVSAVWGNTLWSRHVAVLIDLRVTLIIPALPQPISLEKGEGTPRCWMCIGWSLARKSCVRGTCGKNVNYLKNERQRNNTYIY